jgi:hypothetical protein
MLYKDPNDFLQAYVTGKEERSLLDWIENGVYSGLIEFGLIPDPAFL